MAVAESCAEGASRRTDVADFLLLGGGIFFLIFALVEGQKLGWDSAPTLGSGRYRALYCNRGVTGRYTSAVSKLEAVALSPELSTTKQVVTLSRRDLSFEPHVLQIDREPEVFHPTEQLCRLEELLDVEHARFARGSGLAFGYQCRYDPGGAALSMSPDRARVESGAVTDYPIGRSIGLPLSIRRSGLENCFSPAQPTTVDG